MWHLIGLKSRVLILLREGLVSVDVKAVADARLVSVDSKGVSTGGPRGGGDVRRSHRRWDVEKRALHVAHRQFSGIILS